MPRLIPNNMPAEEPSPFDVFNSISEVCGFVWKLHGEEGLRQCLDELFANGDRQFGPYREQLEEAAVDLAAVGLSKAADIVAEAVPQAPSEAACPYPPGPNAQQWAQSYMNRQRQKRRLNARESNGC